MVSLLFLFSGCAYRGLMAGVKKSWEAVSEAFLQLGKSGETGTGEPIFQLRETAGSLACHIKVCDGVSLDRHKTGLDGSRLVTE